MNPPPRPTLAAVAGLAAMLALSGCGRCGRTAPSTAAPAGPARPAASGHAAPALPSAAPAGPPASLGVLSAAAAPPLPPLVAGGGVDAPADLPLRDDVDGTPQLSPEGKRVVFAALVGGRHQLVVADRDGKGARRLSDGRTDDVDPTFGADSETIFFASGTPEKHDLWRMKVDGTARQRLTETPDDARWPRVSPIAFQLEPFTSGGTDASGGEVHALTYHRVLYQRGAGASAAVWGMLDDGRFPVRVSPEGLPARHPAWSPDGLQLAFDAGPESSPDLVLGTGHTVDRECVRGATCPAFLELLEPSADPKAPPRVVQVTQEQALGAPKDWFSYDLRVLAGTRGLAAPAFFANQTALLASRTRDGAAELVAVDFDGGVSRLLAGHVRPGTGGAFAPLGDAVTWAAAERTGAGTLRVAASRFYLSEALNLYRYPELVRGKPARLAANRFVVVPGTEREYFHLYEKVRYAKRGVFVTTDAATQLASDLLEAAVQRAERERIGPLAALLRDLLDAALHDRREAGAAEAEALDAVARHVAVALALLSEVKVTRIETEYGPTSWEVTPVTTDAALAALRLPAPLAEEVRAAVVRVHSAAEVTADLDLTRFEPRGHYDDGGALAAWFRAVSWLGMAPLGTVEQPEPWLAAWRLMKRHRLLARWERLDADATLLAGEPEDPSFRDLGAVVGDDARRAAPAGPDGAQALMAAVLARRPPGRIAGAIIGTARNPAEAAPLVHRKALTFLPQRASPDGAWLQALTTPLVEDRQYPDPLDVLAVLGSSRARVLLERGELAGDGARAYADAYRHALDALGEEGKRVASATAPHDLPAAWLRAIALLASPPAAGPAAPAFTRSEAWKDRALVSAVGAYALYKHAAVLYAKQPTAAEAGEGGDDLSYWRERPLEKPVRGYVEPNPLLYRALAALARQGEAIAPARWKELKGQAAKLFERLAALSEKELRRAPLDAEEYAWIDEAGASIEQFYVFNESGEIDRSPERLEHGVKLVTDVFTNLNPKERKVLEVATGDVGALYVVTPHGGEQLLTEGGACSVYVLTVPLDGRLTDREWAEQVDGGRQPPAPAWTASFVEPLEVSGR